MIRPRPEVFATPAVPHGGSTDPRVLDFSANLNPFGPSPKVVEAVRAARWDAYPDPRATALRHRIADRHGVGPDDVLVGNGGSELIDLVCRAYLSPGDRVAVCGPTYGEYARSAQLCGASCEAIPALHLGGFRLVFVCSPNNPTGRVTPVEAIQRAADDGPDTLLVVDEAYADCVPGFASAVGLRRANVLVLRSLTKAHGLAGLRVGYAIGPAEVIDAVGRVQPPWSVNAVVLAAAEAATRDEDHTRRVVADWLALRDELVAGLRALGLEPRTSATPYFLLPNPPGEPWTSRLARHGIAVRDCASLGLPGVVRISPRLGLDNARLLAAAREELTHP